MIKKIVNKNKPKNKKVINQKQDLLKEIEKKTLIQYIEINQINL